MADTATTPATLPEELRQSPGARSVGSIRPEEANTRGGSHLPPLEPQSEQRGRLVPRPTAWWQIQLFRGMANDVGRRAPYYWSDWVDALDYRVVPATVYMYFAK
jgi:hypothetical protein